jgi:hypothetical protein
MYIQEKKNNSLANYKQTGVKKVFQDKYTSPISVVEIAINTKFIIRLKEL